MSTARAQAGGDHPRELVLPAGATVASWELGRVGCTIEADPFGPAGAFAAQALHFDTGCAVHLEGPRVGDNAWTRAALGAAAALLADPRLDSREDSPQEQTYEGYWATISPLLVAASADFRAARGAAMPDEAAALKVMYHAFERLAELGWRRGLIGAPRDGRSFEAIEPGSTGVHPCHYACGNFYVGSGTFVAPSHPIMWRPAREASRG
ncbi:hypothetical protein [Longimicrobium sp.]|uniref:hypothetical protein n=1 Tax=Longimicrobium sp. TaxID=2029185 RepID=UPI002E34F64B|nr:hypothetical protein [Longimicrobium sp.]HEX6040293.1 hypothetical protein [Longimicrobium sp.]